MAPFGKVGNGNGSGGPGISLEVDAALSLSSSMDGLSKHLAAAARQERATPRYFKYPYTIAVGAGVSTIYAVDIGGPLQGRHWFINRVSGNAALGSGAITTSPVFLMASGQAAQTQNTVSWPANATGTRGFFQSVNIEFIDTAIPISQDWSREQFIVTFPEHLWVAAQQPSASPTAFFLAGLVQITDLAQHEDPRYMLNQ